MNKRKSWIYSVFVVVIITGIVLCLIFLPKNDNDNSNDDSQDEIVDEENDNNEKDLEEPIEIYATSFTVNLPSTINLLVGTSADLLSGYIQVKPSEATNKVTMEILPRYNSSALGLEFSNSTLIAKEVGTYNLVFSVPKSESTKFSKTILVTIYESKTNAHLSQIENILIKGEETNINEIFTIKDNSAFNVETDSKITYANNYLIANSLGTSNINMSFTESYIQYVYEFEVTIKEQPLYSIVLDEANSTIEIDISSSPICHISYEIKNREEGSVSQALLVEAQDETIAYVESIAEPIIKIRALKVGTTTLTLICEADSSVSTEITIVVK